MAKATAAEELKTAQARIAELEKALEGEKAQVVILTTQNSEQVDSIKELQALLDAPRALALPEGYVLLPVVPDEEMMLAGSDDQESAWDAPTTGRQIRRRVLEAVTGVLLNRDVTELLTK